MRELELSDEEENYEWNQYEKEIFDFNQKNSKRESNYNSKFIIHDEQSENDEDQDLESEGELIRKHDSHQLLTEVKK